MTQRVDLNPELEVVEMPAQILNEVFAHARETLPEECCGLIVGTPSRPHRLVVRCRNEMTRHHQRDAVAYPRDGTQGFYMNEIDYLRAQQEAQARRESVTVVYHSHVDCGAYFSAMDQDFATRPLYPFPDADHLVVGVAGGHVKEQALFRLDPETGRFAGHGVVSLLSEAAPVRRQPQRCDVPR